MSGQFEPREDFKRDHTDKFYVSIRVNDQWLLNFDSRDDPNLLLPHNVTCSQGMTFSTQTLCLSKRLKIPELEEDMNTGVAILFRRPERLLSHAEINSELDILLWNVLDSATRLDGFLLLDLATCKNLTI